MLESHHALRLFVIGLVAVLIAPLFSRSLDNGGGARAAAPGGTTSHVAWMSRVRAVGLDPNDPNLQHALRALADKRIAAFRAESARLKMKLHVPPSPSSLQNRSGTSSGLSRNQSVGRNAVVQTSGPQQTPLSMGKNFVIQQPTPVITSIDQQSWGFPVVIQGTGFQWGSKAPTVTFDMGSCGKHQVVPDSGNWSNESITINPPEDYGPPPLPHDKDPFATSTTVAVGSATSNPFTFNYQQPGWVYSNISIVAKAPHFSLLYVDPGQIIGLSEGSSIFYSSSADRVSTNPTDPVVSGDDVIGYGINVLNGFQSRATIRIVSSYMDPPNYSSTADQYRGAVVTQQPADGRLEMKVHWYYAGGESVSYVVELDGWGPYGRRSLSSLPKMGFCYDEQ